MGAEPRRTAATLLLAALVILLSDRARGDLVTVPYSGTITKVVDSYDNKFHDGPWHGLAPLQVGDRFNGTIVLDTSARNFTADFVTTGLSFSDSGTFEKLGLPPGGGLDVYGPSSNLATTHRVVGPGLSEFDYVKYYEILLGPNGSIDMMFWHVSLQAADPQFEISGTIASYGTSGLQTIPEPSALVLGGIGVALVGLGHHTRRRRRRAA